MPVDQSNPDLMWGHERWLKAARDVLTSADLQHLFEARCIAPVRDGDVVLSRNPQPEERLREIRDIWESVDHLLDGIVPKLNRHRAIVLMPAGTEQKCVQSPDNYSIIFVSEASLSETPQDWMHELAHSRVLSGRPDLDEGLALLAEKVISRGYTLGEAAKDKPWLGRLVLSSIPTINVYSRGLAAMAGALLLGGTQRLAASVDIWAAMTPVACTQAMLDLTEKARAEAQSVVTSEEPIESSNLENLYFSGALEAFFTGVEALTVEGVELTEEDWLNLARFACLAIGISTKTDATRRILTWIDRNRASAPPDATVLFAIADDIKELREHSSQVGFADAARAVLDNLARHPLDHRISADIVLNHGWLSINLPEFAGGSVETALLCADTLEQKLGRAEAADRLRKKAG